MDFSEIVQRFIKVFIASSLILIFALILVRYLRLLFSKTVTTDATVIERYDIKTKRVFRFRGEYEITNYVVKFQTDEKILTFYVSFFVYDMLKVGEQGQLTRKGEKFVDFSSPPYENI